MGHMIRKQVYIEPEQNELLKGLAKSLGVSEAELIRRGIEQLGRRAPTTMIRDRQAWQEELKFIKERARTREASGGRRTWTREELYEERPKRFSR